MSQSCTAQAGRLLRCSSAQHLQAVLHTELCRITTRFRFKTFVCLYFTCVCVCVCAYACPCPCPCKPVMILCPQDVLRTTLCRMLLIHTCIHTYTHTLAQTSLIHAYIHTCIHTYTHTWAQTKSPPRPRKHSINVCICAYTNESSNVLCRTNHVFFQSMCAILFFPSFCGLCSPSCIHTYHTYIHTYIHVHACMHAYTLVLRQPVNIQECAFTCFFKFMYGCLFCSFILWLSFFVNLWIYRNVSLCVCFQSIFANLFCFFILWPVFPFLARECAYNNPSLSHSSFCFLTCGTTHTYIHTYA